MSDRLLIDRLASRPNDCSIDRFNVEHWNDRLNENTWQISQVKGKNHLCFWPIGWMVTMMNVVKCRNLVHFHCGFSELLFSTSLLFWHLFRRQVFGLCQNQKENIFKYLHFFWFCFLFSYTNFCEITKTSQKLRKKKYLANDGWRPLFNSGLNFFFSGGYSRKVTTKNDCECLVHTNEVLTCIPLKCKHDSGSQLL